VVMVKGPGGLPAVYLCAMGTTANSVKPAACRAMYSTLLAADAQNRPVAITFSSDQTSCAAIKSWDWATDINWVVLEN